MRASDVIVRVRSTFGDKDSAQIQDDDFIRWINDAQKEIASKFEYNQTKGIHDLIMGEGEYSLPAEVYKIYSVIANGRPLIFVKAQEAMERTGDTGDPVSYWIWDRVLTLYPKPSLGKLGGLVIYYLSLPEEVITTDGALTVPVEYHARVVDYCLAQAYLIDNDREGYGLVQSKMAADFPVFYNDRTGDSTAYYPSIGVSDEYD